jgi:diguanylate cyclase (GGDEF)-like protein
MLAVGVLVFRLISDSAQAKTEARANGLVTTAASLYAAQEMAASADAASLARAVSSLSSPQLLARVKTIAADSGLARVVVSQDGSQIAQYGSSDAVAPGTAEIAGGVAGNTVVKVSATTADQFADDLTGPGVGVVIRERGRTVTSTVPGAGTRSLPASGDVTIDGTGYYAVVHHFVGFGGPSTVDVAVLSSLAATATSLGTSRLFAAAFIAGFLLLAFGFAVLASRGLEGQIGRFLQAARRLAGGDFSAPVPIEGRDEFAELASEFNSMSAELEQRLEELTSERKRLRESIRRAGETFASNLDRVALLELALKTAVDGVAGDSGRVSARAKENGPLLEATREGQLSGLGELVVDSERHALATGNLGEAQGERVSVASLPLGPYSEIGRPHGLLTVARHGEPFSDDDRDLLRSLANQTTLALENVRLHEEVQRQAVTDELTGLANHGRFQEVLGGEMDQVRRYHYEVGLIMLDIDNFKRVNDTYGHPQGDVVLKHVARVLRDTSREADSPARYGGEEMALILPHTDMEGSYAIAERLRTAIEGLRVPRLDGQGVLRVTASLGVGASTTGIKDELISETDAALYRAKREGKNRTIRAQAATANASRAE